MAVAPPRARLLLFVNDLWNAANFRLRLIEALEAKGHSVSIAGPPHPVLESMLRTPSRDVHLIPMRKEGLGPFEEARLLARVLYLLRRKRPGVLLSFTPKPNIYGALAASMLGIPALPNVSGLGTAFIRGGALRRLLALLYRAAFRRVPHVFFQNEEDLRMFVGERLVRPDQARLLPGSGVDLERFAPRPERPPDGTTRFLFVGRLLGDKGVRDLAEAARQLRRRHPDARVQLLGFADSDNRTAITRSELDSWVAAGTLEYLGATDDVRPHIAAADAVVLPSYREGLPRSLLEAGAMGKPLIATDVPGNRSVVDHELNGFLCRPADPPALAGAMERFLRLPAAERRRMGARSREKVVAGFSEAKVIAAYIDTIDQLIREKASA